MEYHANELRKACRVCGRRVNKAKGRERSYLVAQYIKELAEVFSIDAANDCEDTHPLTFCHICRVFMRTWHIRGGGTPSVGRVFTWIKHSEPKCPVSYYLKSCNFRYVHHTNLSGLSALRYTSVRRQNWRQHMSKRQAKNDCCRRDVIKADIHGTSIFLPHIPSSSSA